MTLDAVPAGDLAARLHNGPGGGAANGVVDLSAYRRDGFTAVPGLLGGGEVEALRAEARRRSRAAIAARSRGRGSPTDREATKTLISTRC